CFNATVEGFWRSFTAALIAFPVYLLLVVTRPDPETGIAAEAALLVETIAYVIDWFAFPVVMLHVAAALDRTERYLGYIVAVNWCNLVQVALFGTILVLRLAGILTGGLSEFLWLVALLWVLSYQWYVARVGLEISGLAAAGIVALAFLISLFVQGIAVGIQTR